MTRDSESRLLDLCVRQHAEFRAQEWLDFDRVTSGELVAACLLLGGSRWYGHRDELLSVAEQLRPGSVGHVSELVSETGFDCPRFSNMLKRELRHALAAS